MPEFSYPLQDDQLEYEFRVRYSMRGGEPQFGDVYLLKAVALAPVKPGDDFGAERAKSRVESTPDFDAAAVEWFYRQDMDKVYDACRADYEDVRLSWADMF